MSRIWYWARLAPVMVLIGTACGTGGGQESTPEPSSLEYDDTAGALIVEADTYGGLLPPASSRHIAAVSIYGDGQVVLAEEDGARRVGTDRKVTIGRVSQQELTDLLAFVADSGYFALEDRYVDPVAPTDGPWRHVTLNLSSISKTVSLYPPDYSGAPDAFWQAYDAIKGIQPSELTAFVPTSGTLTATDLGPIEDLPGGRANQVAPWDTPLVGLALEEAIKGAHLEGEQYRLAEEFLLRYPSGQVFGSQEGTAYRVSLAADLPWETGSP